MKPIRPMPMRLARLFGATLLIHALFATVAQAEAPETSEFPRPTMRTLFQEIKTLIPLSVNKESWGAPEQRDAILKSLARLERAADQVERHGRDREAGFSQIAENLIGDLGDSYAYYQSERFEEARFLFTGSLNSCVSCHVRLSSDRSFPLAKELIEDKELEGFAPRDRAWLLVTVRRFDEALAIWEGLIRDGSLRASKLDASGVLVDYLNVAIRVRGDIPRVTRTLDGFAKRTDLPVYLSRRVGEWREALSALPPKQFKPGSVGSHERGIALAREGGAVANGPYGRDGLVQDLAAASHLVRWLEQDHADRRMAKASRNLTPAERNDLALAYYWLGVVEARSLDGFWINLSERHLEAAVRADPKGPIAEKAYSMLEESQILGYGGASGEQLPSDVWTLLKDLREIMGLDRGDG